MSVYRPIGILGGTFDPIHYGHLAIADYLSSHLPLEYLHFVPCLQPPHRTAPAASPEHRLAMLKLAIENHPNWIANDLDYQRLPPSYMVDTLTLLRKQQPKAAWCLILGMDAYAQFNRWHEWQKILTLAHLIVVNRPHHTLPTEKWSQDLLSRAQVNSADYFRSHAAGGVLLQDIPPSPICATAIRHDFKEYSLWLPAKVREYIVMHHLYATR